MDNNGYHPSEDPGIDWDNIDLDDEGTRVRLEEQFGLVKPPPACLMCEERPAAHVMVDGHLETDMCRCCLIGALLMQCEWSTDSILEDLAS